ncbi:MAG: hypothetical protein ACYTEK_06165 [Planctomycetota bacterium]|jgi:hypothetical protein
MRLTICELSGVVRVGILDALDVPKSATTAEFVCFGDDYPVALMDGRFTKKGGGANQRRFSSAGV